jgi:cytochrome b561
MVGEQQKYNISLRILHWVMAIIIIGMIGIGWYMSDLPRENPLKGTLIGIHKSFGVLILILFFVRIFFRLATAIPPLPETIRLMERRLAGVGHKALYVFIGIVPLSGYAMSNLYGYGVSLFGIPLPKIFPENKELAALAREAHEILPYILLGIIIVHIAAVVRHRFFDRPENNVLSRIV